MTQRNYFFPDAVQQSKNFKTPSIDLEKGRMARPIHYKSRALITELFARLLSTLLLSQRLHRSFKYCFDTNYPDCCQRNGDQDHRRQCKDLPPQGYTEREEKL